MSLKAFLLCTDMSQITLDWLWGKESKLFLVPKKYDWSSERFPFMPLLTAQGPSAILCHGSPLAACWTKVLEPGNTEWQKGELWGYCEWLLSVPLSPETATYSFMYAGFLATCHQSEIQSAEGLTLPWTVARDFIISLWLRELCSICFFSHTPYVESTDELSPEELCLLPIAFSPLTL